MSGRTPEETVRSPVLRQRWSEVLFVHWRYPVDTVAALLPDGLTSDVHDGDAWVTLTPFRVERARLPLMPALPFVSEFPETNLRTYVRGPDGQDGLWFFTLEVDSLTSALGGRLLVPYRCAEMTVATDDEGITRYESERRSDRLVGHRIRARAGRPLDERHRLDDWLTGRWRAWIRRAGQLGLVPVRHQEWPLHHAELVECEETLLAAHGLPQPEREPVVHFSPGVDATLGLPRLPGRRSAASPIEGDSN